MQPLQQPMVQCLDLSRPDSISTAGYCADVVTQATRCIHLQPGVDP